MNSVEKFRKEIQAEKHITLQKIYEIATKNKVNFIYMVRYYCPCGRLKKANTILVDWNVTALKKPRKELCYNYLGDFIAELSKGKYIDEIVAEGIQKWKLHQ